MICFIDKAWPDEGAAVGYEKIVMEAAKVGEDPLEVFNRDVPNTVTGKGTKAEPFMVPSRNKKRCVLVSRKHTYIGILVWLSGPKY